ncbi:photosystem II subunit X [Hibiscus trionum]|uniref:Photosystem II subunit X n=1 Tax=Hibiscus trionum TaxID=183268 RepID=A0A9W7JLU0_HIBTR|nr:photosystem II subunit X [Hibiscus trionum]
MASTSAVSMALPLTRATQNRVAPSSEAFFKPLPVKPSRAVSTVTRPNGKLQVKASSSFREKAVTGLTAAALTTSMMIPEVAQAADGVTPSLKNFLLSIAAGGVVVVAIIGVVIGVSNFDPVKRT